ncbi:MAG: TPM domain-containing protein [Piscinibacter sp.]|uniref:TPM domain-containing protein n=1 Tax=Piscinibacter sp. TaxID=1903157 RepID=UPI001B4AE512|nr:TPM domain-containing protein [Piscinibacter sp.]MBP5990899.1 TPM domain-containing protein [Piscinibacter sp.]MBP6028463.1 TPM domain-containing protein [Piscinibacter sp.]
MNRFGRILKHRWLDERDLARTLDDALLTRIEARVAASEKRHSGEIRVCAEAGLPLSYLWRGASARERALAMFGKLRVWDTEHNNGVLIYLLLAEHRIEIVADRGLDRQVSAAQWRDVMERMRAAFRQGEFEAGLNAAIDAVDALLVQHFPLAPGEHNPNELPDKPHLR